MNMHAPFYIKSWLRFAPRPTASFTLHNSPLSNRETNRLSAQTWSQLITFKWRVCVCALHVPLQDYHKFKDYSSAALSHLSDKATERPFTPSFLILFRNIWIISHFFLFKWTRIPFSSVNIWRALFNIFRDDKCRFHSFQSFLKMF